MFFFFFFIAMNSQNVKYRPLLTKKNNTDFSEFVQVQCFSFTGVILHYTYFFLFLFASDLHYAYSCNYWSHCYLSCTGTVIWWVLFTCCRALICTSRPIWSYLGTIILTFLIFHTKLTRLSATCFSEFLKTESNTFTVCKFYGVSTFIFEMGNSKHWPKFEEIRKIGKLKIFLG